MEKLNVKKMKRSCEEVAHLLKTLAHPQRLLILCHLSNGELTVMELVKLTEVSQSQVSQFLTRMKAEGLVECRREGTYQYYCLSDTRLSGLLKFLHSSYCP
jgi:DNA-binding transcriptional ArsR family regulator